MRQLISSDTPATSRLTEIEVASALERLVREGAIARTECDRALTALVTDLPAIVVVELTDDVCASARRLLRQHPLRANDAIQLASCLYLQEQLALPVPMVVCDDRLLAAARLEGLRVSWGLGIGDSGLGIEGLGISSVIDGRLGPCLPSGVPWPGQAWRSHQ